MTTKVAADDLVMLALPERKFQAEVERWYFLAGWRAVFHDRDSRKNDPGFPDLVAAGPPEWLRATVGTHGPHFRELKAQGGRLRPDQEAWGEALLASGADWAVRYTRDWRRVREECGLAAMEALAADGRQDAIRFLFDRCAAWEERKKDRARARAGARIRRRLSVR